MELALFVGGAVYAVAMLWFGWCSYRTLNERLLIINAVADSASIEAFDDLLDVTFDHHLLRKLLFMDPMQAYSTRTRTLVDNYVTG